MVVWESLDFLSRAHKNIIIQYNDDLNELKMNNENVKIQEKLNSILNY